MPCILLISSYLFPIEAIPQSFRQCNQCMEIPLMFDTVHCGFNTLYVCITVLKKLTLKMYLLKNF